MNSVITILFFILSGPQQFQNRVNCLCFAWPLTAAINDECHESKNTFLKKFIFDKKHWFGMRYNRGNQSDTDYVIHKGWLHLTRWCILWQAYNCKEKAQKFVCDTTNHCKSSHNMQHISFYTTRLQLYPLSKLRLIIGYISYLYSFSETWKWHKPYLFLLQCYMITSITIFV